MEHLDWSALTGPSYSEEYIPHGGEEHMSRLKAKVRDLMGKGAYERLAVIKRRVMFGGKQLAHCATRTELDLGDFGRRYGTGNRSRV